MTAQHYGPCKTLSPENQFRFVCPVFKAETKIASCFAVRDLHARGEGPPTRRGCQVAMTTGKCPVWVILRDMRRTDEDPYYSDVPKLGTLGDDVLNHIAPIMSPDRILDRAAISAAELAALRARNDDAVAGVGRTAKQKTKAAAKLKADAPPLEDVVSIEPAITDAAKTGDMTAAINAEINQGE
jgi:hypothetical protein